MSDLSDAGLTSSSIKDRLAQIRVQAGEANQKAMSLRLGLSANAWRLMETGGGLPSADTLLRLADLGFSPTWVLTGQGPMRLGDAAAAELPPAQESAGQKAVSRMLERHVDLDLLDEAFRDALRAARIPEAAVKDPHLLMILTVATYDVRILEQAAARSGDETSEAKGELARSSGD